MTDGASAPDIMVEGLLARLRELGAGVVRELSGEPESMVFALPKELLLQLVDRRARRTRVVCLRGSDSRQDNCSGEQQLPEGFSRRRQPQPPVLLFTFFQSGDHGHFHIAKLAALPVERGRVHAVLAAQLGTARRPGRRALGFLGAEVCRRGIFRCLRRKTPVRRSKAEVASLVRLNSTAGRQENCMATIRNHPACDANGKRKAAARSVLRLLPHILVFFISFSSATGCTAMSDADTSAAPFRDQQSTAEAKSQIEHWIVSEMPLAEAVQVLGARGFSCRPVDTASGEFKSSILCFYSTPPSPPPDQRLTAPTTPINWFVTLNSKDGTVVTNFHVARTPREIGG